MTTDRHDAPPSPATAQLPPTQIGPRLFEWGTRTYVMGIINVTPTRSPATACWLAWPVGGERPARPL